MLTNVEIGKLSSEWFDLKNADWGETKSETSKRCREIEETIARHTRKDPMAVIWGIRVVNALTISYQHPRLFRL